MLDESKITLFIYTVPTTDKMVSSVVINCRSKEDNPVRTEGYLRMPVCPKISVDTVETLS